MTGMKISMLMFICAVSFLSHAADAPQKVRVVVWDEQQPSQKKVYVNFLGNEIAEHLKTQPDFEVTSVKLNDPEQGLTKEILDNCDVLIWWGHVRHPEVSAEKAADIVSRIKTGKLSLIALHSAHWCKPFVKAMEDRAVEDALAKLTEEQRKTVAVKTIPPKPFAAPKKGDPLTPFFELKKDESGKDVLEIKLPMCVFPTWRADAAPGHVKIMLPDHPIAKDVPAQFDIPQTEMYDEPFHVPAPDEVVLEERWDKGEHFRSGMVWKIGKGKVFYFRPGHEIYGVFKVPEVQKIITNAARWLGKK
jgi:trehalose utilization protein